MLHRPAAGLITKQHSPSSWHIEHHELYPSTVASQDRCAAQIWAHSPSGTLLLTACGTRLWAGCDSSACDSLAPAAGPLPFALVCCAGAEDDEVPRPDPGAWDPLAASPKPFFFLLLPWITHACMLVFGMTILHADFWQIGIVSFRSTPASRSAEGFLEKTPPARPPAAVTVPFYKNDPVTAVPGSRAQISWGN